MVAAARAARAMESSSPEAAREAPVRSRPPQPGRLPPCIQKVRPKPTCSAGVRHVRGRMSEHPELPPFVYCRENPETFQSALSWQRLGSVSGESEYGRRSRLEERRGDRLVGVSGAAPRGRCARQPALPAGAPPPQQVGGARERHGRTRWLRDSLLAAASSRRMLTAVKMLAARVARESTRPAWTLLAISSLISAVVVIGLRFVFGA
jgi:hypothetical protein